MAPFDVAGVKRLYPCRATGAEANREVGPRRLRQHAKAYGLQLALILSVLAVFRANLLAAVPWRAFKNRAYIKTASSCVGIHIKPLPPVTVCAV
jgi:hypothetical protein